MIEVQAKLFLVEPVDGENIESIRVVMSLGMVEQPDVEVLLRPPSADGEPSNYASLEAFIRKAFEAKEQERRDIESAFL